MIKKITFFPIFLILLFLLSGFKVITDKGDIKFILNQPVSDYQVSYYDYGANIIIGNVNLKKITVRKFGNNAIRLLPLSDKKALIKIVSDIKNLKNHLIFKRNSNNFEIKLVKKENILTNKVKKINDTNSNKESFKDDLEQKSVVDIANEYALLSKKNNQKKIEKKVKKINKNKKTDKVISFDLETKPIETEKYDFSKNVIKTYSILGILSLFIIFIAIIFRKYKNKLKLNNSSQLVKIIYNQEIVPKKSIVIVKVMNEYYILGVTETNISTVDKISSDSLSEELKVVESNKEKDKFIKYLKKEENNEKNSENIQEKDKLIKLIQGKLKNYQKFYNGNE